MKIKNLAAWHPTQLPYEWHLFSFLLLMIPLTHQLGSLLSSYLSNVYWVPFLLQGPIVIGTLYLAHRWEKKISEMPWLLITTSSLALVLLLTVIQNEIKWTLAFHRSDLSTPSRILVWSASLVAALTTAIQIRRSRTGNFYLAFLFATILSLASWIAFFELPNWATVVNSLVAHPGINGAIYLVCFLLLFKFVFFSKEASHDRPLSTAPKIVIWTIALPIFAYLSFRYDTILQSTSEFHWEYFTGPIRTIKNGHWLLWDTPSQYGFLNIFFASLIPTKSSWQALYIFQSLLLFLCAVISFSILSQRLRSPSDSLLGLLLCIAGLFFADPSHIGPSPYPSSSVMRFALCYLNLAFLAHAGAQGKNRSANFLWGGRILWVLGVLWSAESTIYCTTLHIGTLLAYSRRTTIRETLNEFLQLLSKSLMALAAVMLIISLYYRARLGHWPDWSAFMVYGMSYAKGFGSLAIHPFGEIWILILLLFGLTSVIFTLREKERSNQFVTLAGSMACLWAIGSYYIGRAASNNITAIIPLLLIPTTLFLRASQTKSNHSTGHLLKIIAIPLYMISLLSAFANQDFLITLHKLRSFSSEVGAQVHAADPKLESLLGQAGIKSDDAVTVLSNGPSMPMGKASHGNYTFENTWLPNPLHLLQEPISLSRRERVVHRFFENGKKPGFLVVEKHISPQEKQIWFGVLRKFYISQNSIENDTWQIIKFVPRDL